MALVRKVGVRAEGIPKDPLAAWYFFLGEMDSASSTCIHLPTVIYPLTPASPVAVLTLQSDPSPTETSPSPAPLCLCYTFALPASFLCSVTSPMATAP